MKQMYGVLIWACLCQAAGGQSIPPHQPTTSSHSAFLAAEVAAQSLHIANNGTHPVELVCPRKGPAQSRPATASAEPTEIPDAEDVEQALQDMQATAGTRLVPSPHIGALRQDKTTPFRMAIWGDSHMAAAFFSDQMLRQLTGPAGPNALTVSSRFVHAGVGHGGVRALVRKTCLTGEWAREMAYAHGDAAAAPGPGMTSLLAKRPGATLTLDLRDGQGTARLTRVQILHHGSTSGSTRLGIRVDGEAETEVTLTRQAGPNALELTTPSPLSILQIRVIEGSYRFQGLKLAPTPTPTAIHLDLFAYPGATVAGWVRSDLAYLASWFTDQPYDLALIAFGTNEGNDPRFNETTYRETLTKAIGHFRQVFPQTQCLLISPGDRGVRVVKPKTKKASKNTPQKGGSAQGKAAKNTKPTKTVPSAPAAQLLKFSRIHAQIGQIQTELAAQHGCLAWSMQEAMGGLGSAYPWARKNPPLMAPDLIHFTPAGYRELANRFMADFGLASP